MALLDVKNLSVYYGVIQALKGISFHVDKGEIVALIGSNGAGKTTTLHTLSGLLKPESGEVIYKGMDITKVPGHKIVTMGMAQVPEGRRVFEDMTVAENLKLGAYTRKDHSEMNETVQMVYKRFPRLEERRAQVAGTLSGGEQQMLAVARGLMSRPKILLLDEPSMGLAPIIVNQIYDLIKQIHDSGITVLLVEQNARKALSICDYAYVLENGKIVVSDEGNELLKSDTIRRAYLGG